MLKIYALVFMFILATAGLAQTPRASAPAARAAWARYSPGNIGMSLELPGEAKEVDLPEPEESAKDIQDFRTFLYSGPNWMVLINHYHASDPSGLQGFAEGIVQGITTAAGVTDVKYSLEPNTATDVPISGSYKLNGNPMYFNGFATAKGNDVYLVAAVWPMNDKTTEAAAQRALDSVQFNSR